MAEAYNILNKFLHAVIIVGYDRTLVIEDIVYGNKWYI